MYICCGVVRKDRLTINVACRNRGATAFSLNAGKQTLCQSGFLVGDQVPLNLQLRMYAYFVIQRTQQQNLTFLTYIFFFIINSVWVSLFFLIIMPSLR